MRWRASPPLFVAGIVLATLASGYAHTCLGFPLITAALALLIAACVGEYRLARAAPGDISPSRPPSPSAAAGSRRRQDWIVR